MSQFQTINEFSIGNRVYGHFLIFTAEPGETRDKKSKYLDFTLMDRTGEINAKLWDALPAQIEQFKQGTLVYATGTVTEYRNAPQLKIEHIELAPTHFKLQDFVQSAPLSIEEMVDFLTSRIAIIERDDIRRIIQWGSDQAGEKLLTYPAAKGMHHAVYSGLLYHIVSMLKLADQLLTIYPWLNRDLLYFGIVWHDIEKVNEVEAENGKTIKRTVAGELLGHITQGVVLIERAMRELNIEDDELRTVLQHIILSHHDKPEWGSPVAPMLPEAFMLHMIDNLDAKMYAINHAFETRKEGEAFTDPIPSLGKLRMYHFPRK